MLPHGGNAARRIGQGFVDAQFKLAARQVQGAGDMGDMGDMGGNRATCRDPFNQHDILRFGHAPLCAAA